MKKIVLLMMLCLYAVSSNAQENADILVNYDYTSPNLSTGKVESKSQYMLLANGTASKFYSPQTQYLDSLESTPQGKAALKEITFAAVKNGDYDKIPKRNGSFYVTKSAGRLRSYDSAGTTKYVVDEAVPDINWEICDSIKTILGYECTKAIADFHGRKWTVWFTPEIPIQSGPWKLLGLPGIILEANADNQYIFTATGLQQSRQPITDVPMAENYEKTNRINYLKAKRSFIDNPFGTIDAQYGGVTVSVIDEKGNSVDTSQRLYVTRDVADFIETDY